MIEMMLDQRFVVDLSIRSDSKGEDQIRTVLRAPYERLFRGLPELLALGVNMRHGRSELDRVRKWAAVTGRIADEGYARDAEPLKSSLHALHNRQPKNVQISKRHSSDTFLRARDVAIRTSNQHNRPYIHDCHLGAAARKIAERDGTHEGIRRKREIGSRARVRC